MIIYVYLIFSLTTSVYALIDCFRRHNRFSISFPVEYTLRSVLSKVVGATQYPRSAEMEKRELGERADDERGGGRISRAG